MSCSSKAKSLGIRVVEEEGNIHTSCAMELLCCLLSKPKYLHFSFPELASLAQLEGVSLSQLLSKYTDEVPDRSSEAIKAHFAEKCKSNPALYVHLPSPASALRLLARSVCIDKFIQVFSSGPNIDSLISQLQSTPNPEFTSDISDPENSFAFYVDYFKDSVAYEDQLRIFDRFEPLQFAGRVNPANPKLRFWVIRDLNGTFYFGKEAAKSKERTRFYSKYSLNHREYLGPTSTDNELAFLMVNEGLVQAGSLVLDPFVGTGSVLVAASHFGALCFGSDIDMRVLKGFSVGRSRKHTQADIFTNFKNYGLALPEILRIDSSKPSWKQLPVFDAIVCDPPYGVRARSRTAGTKTGDLTYVPDSNQYEGRQLVADLLEMAAGLLRVGGRLVFLLPTDRASYCREMLPVHPYLQLLSNSENVLSRKISRRLLTYERLAEPQMTCAPGKDFYSGLRKLWFEPSS